MRNGLAGERAQPGKLGVSGLQNDLSECHGKSVETSFPPSRSFSAAFSEILVDAGSIRWPPAGITTLRLPAGLSMFFVADFSGPRKTYFPNLRSKFPDHVPLNISAISFCTKGVHYRAQELFLKVLET
jgi:hypothetical protein